MNSSLHLEVHKVDKLDVYKDIARIHEDVRGKNIEEGEIYKLSVNGKSKLVSIRGLADEVNQSGIMSPIIRLDDITRNRLSLECGKSYDFKIKPANFLGKSLWLCSAPDPALRIPAILGIWSFILGIISLFLSFY